MVELLQILAQTENTLHVFWGDASTKRGRIANKCSLVAASALVLLPVTPSPSLVSLVLARQRRTAPTLNTSPQGRKPKFLKSRPRKVGALVGNSTHSTQTVHGEEEEPYIYNYYIYIYAEITLWFLIYNVTNSFHISSFDLLWFQRLLVPFLLFYEERQLL